MGIKYISCRVKPVEMKYSSCILCKRETQMQVIFIYIFKYRLTNFTECENKLLLKIVSF